MTLTKENLVETVRDVYGLKGKDSRKLVETLLGIIKDTLVNGEDVLITGFGKFFVKEKKERKGRNPSTGEDMMLRSRRIVGFKCSEKLRDRMNR